MIKEYVSKICNVFVIKKAGYVLAVLLFLVLPLAVGGVLYWHIYVPAGHPEDNREHLFEVPQGATTREVGEKLEDRDLIRSSLVFREYVRFSQQDQQIIAGNYLLTPSMNLSEIARQLAGGETVEEDTIVFTVPEGRSIEQIATLLAERGMVDRENFLNLAQNPPQDILDSYSFLQEEYPELKYVLEGYLFPETYEVVVDATEEEIITTMLEQLEKNIVDKREDIEDTGMTLHEILILASIIEREARVDHEREIIASVFHNRLEIDQPLESCATIQYAIGEIKEVLLHSDLEHESPYNTYQRKGLPPGPIASPGLASIKAALYPADTDYRYFVSKGDGSGEHLFAETHEGHIRNRNEVNH